MRTVVVDKAQPVTRDGETPDMRIDITGALPDFDGDLERWAAYADGQAGQIESAMHASLPGGVYDRLFAIMARRKATLFRVAHTE